MSSNLAWLLLANDKSILLLSEQ